MNFRHITILATLCAGTLALAESPIEAKETAPATVTNGAVSVLSIEEAETLIKMKTYLLNQLAETIEQANQENITVQADKLRELISTGRVLDVEMEKITPEQRELLTKKVELMNDLEYAESRFDNTMNNPVGDEREYLAFIIATAMLEGMASQPPTPTEDMTEETAALTNNLICLWNDMSAVFEQATAENVAEQKEKLRELQQQLQVLQQEIAKLSPEQIAAMENAPAVYEAMRRLAESPRKLEDQQEILNELVKVLDENQPSETDEVAPDIADEPLSAETLAFVEKTLVMMTNVAEVIEQTTPENVEAQAAKLKELRHIADTLGQELENISPEQRLAVENNTELMSKLAEAEARIDAALEKVLSAGNEKVSRLLMEAING